MKRLQNDASRCVSKIHDRTSQLPRFDKGCRSILGQVSRLRTPHMRRRSFIDDCATVPELLPSYDHRLRAAARIHYTNKKSGAERLRRGRMIWNPLV